MKNIAVFCKHTPSVDRDVVRELTGWLRARALNVFMDRDTAKLLGETSDYERADIPGKVDLIVVLGGDGTLLSVVRIAHAFDVPILAVNLGSLGFLTAITLGEIYPTLEKVLRKEYDLDHRMLLTACMKRDGAPVAEFHVLNDVVINKGGAGPHRQPAGHSQRPVHDGLPRGRVDPRHAHGIDGVFAISGRAHHPPQHARSGPLPDLSVHADQPADRHSGSVLSFKWS